MARIGRPQEQLVMHWRVAGTAGGNLGHDGYTNPAGHEPADRIERRNANAKRQMMPQARCLPLQEHIIRVLALKDAWAMRELILWARDFKALSPQARLLAEALAPPGPHEA